MRRLGTWKLFTKLAFIDHLTRPSFSFLAFSVDFFTSSITESHQNATSHQRRKDKRQRARTHIAQQQARPPCEIGSAVNCILVTMSPTSIISAKLPPEHPTQLSPCCSDLYDIQFFWTEHISILEWVTNWRQSCCWPCICSILFECTKRTLRPQAAWRCQRCGQSTPAVQPRKATVNGFF